MNENLKKVLQAIPQFPQRQDSETDQLTDDGIDPIPYSVVIHPAWLKDRISLDAYDIADLAGVSKIGMTSMQFKMLRAAGEKAAREAIKETARRMGLTNKRRAA